MIWVVAVISVVITIIVVWLSILTLNKGYGYNHKVDPLPSQSEENHQDNGEERSNLKE